jgi:hypothetical protein
MTSRLLSLLEVLYSDFLLLRKSHTQDSYAVPPTPNISGVLRHVAHLHRRRLHQNTNSKGACSVVSNTATLMCSCVECSRGSGLWKVVDSGIRRCCGKDAHRYFDEQRRDVNLTHWIYVKHRTGERIWDIVEKRNCWQRMLRNDIYL